MNKHDRVKIGGGNVAPEVIAARRADPVAWERELARRAAGPERSPEEQARAAAAWDARKRALGIG